MTVTEWPLLGVSRRDFLKYCGSIAALLGLSETEEWERKFLR